MMAIIIDDKDEMKMKTGFWFHPSMQMKGDTTG